MGINNELGMLTPMEKRGTKRSEDKFSMPESVELLRWLSWAVLPHFVSLLDSESHLQSFWFSGPSL